MRNCRPILVAAVITAMVTMTGCSHLLAVYTPVEMQMVDRRANFVDDALSHSYSDRRWIFGHNASSFGGRIPDWLVAERANHRVATEGPGRVWANLHSYGCEPTGERSCAYRKVMRMLVNRVETERGLVTLHFTLSADAATGCTTCIDVRLVVSGSVGRDD